MNNKWTSYYKKTKTNNPLPLLITALKFVKEKNHALDLGSGAGNDSRFLKEQGFSVTSVDKSPEVKKFLPEAIITPFSDFDFPLDYYDIVHAQYSLPFNPPDTFSEVFLKLTNSLKKGGIFTGQFFGKTDEWSNLKHMSFHTKEEILEFLKPYKILLFTERKENGKMASGGTKFWHRFNIIAEKI